MRVRTEDGTLYELDLDDADAWVRFTSADAVTVRVPPRHRVLFPAGESVIVEQAGAGAVTIQPAGGVTIHTSETSTLAKRHAAATLICIADDEWVLSGYLTAA